MKIKTKKTIIALGAVSAISSSLIIPMVLTLKTDGDNDQVFWKGHKFNNSTEIDKFIMKNTEKVDISDKDLKKRNIYTLSLGNGNKAFASLSDALDFLKGKIHKVTGYLEEKYFIDPNTGEIDNSQFIKKVENQIYNIYRKNTTNLSDGDMKDSSSIISTASYMMAPANDVDANLKALVEAAKSYINVHVTYKFDGIYFENKQEVIMYLQYLKNNHKSYNRILEDQYGSQNLKYLKLPNNSLIFLDVGSKSGADVKKALEDPKSDLYKVFSNQILDNISPYVKYIDKYGKTIYLEATEKNRARIKEQLSNDILNYVKVSSNNDTVTEIVDMDKATPNGNIYGSYFFETGMSIMSINKSGEWNVADDRQIQSFGDTIDSQMIKSSVDMMLYSTGYKSPLLLFANAAIKDRYDGDRKKSLIQFLGEIDSKTSNKTGHKRTHYKDELYNLVANLSKGVRYNSLDTISSSYKFLINSFISHGESVENIYNLAQFFDSMSYILDTYLTKKLSPFFINSAWNVEETKKKMEGFHLNYFRNAFRFFDEKKLGHGINFQRKSYSVYRRLMGYEGDVDSISHKNVGRNSRTIFNLLKSMMGIDSLSFNSISKQSKIFKTWIDPFDYSKEKVKKNDLPSHDSNTYKYLEFLGINESSPVFREKKIRNFMKNKFDKSLTKFKWDGKTVDKTTNFYKAVLSNILIDNDEQKLSNIELNGITFTPGNLRKNFTSALNNNSLGQTSELTNIMLNKLMQHYRNLFKLEINNQSSLAKKTIISLKNKPVNEIVSQLNDKNYKPSVTSMDYYAKKNALDSAIIKPLEQRIISFTRQAVNSTIEVGMLIASSVSGSGSGASAGKAVGKASKVSKAGAKGVKSAKGIKKGKSSNKFKPKSRESFSERLRQKASKYLEDKINDSQIDFNKASAKDIAKNFLKDKLDGNDANSNPNSVTAYNKIRERRKRKHDNDNDYDIYSNSKKAKRSNGHNTDKKNDKKNNISKSELDNLKKIQLEQKLKKEKLSSEIDDLNSDKNKFDDNLLNSERAIIDLDNDRKGIKNQNAILEEQLKNSIGHYFNDKEKASNNIVDKIDYKIYNDKFIDEIIANQTKSSVGSNPANKAFYKVIKQSIDDEINSLPVDQRGKLNSDKITNSLFNEAQTSKDHWIRRIVYKTFMNQFGVVLKANPNVNLKTKVSAKYSEKSIKSSMNSFLSDLKAGGKKSGQNNLNNFLSEHSKNKSSKNNTDLPTKLADFKNAKETLDLNKNKLNDIDKEIKDKTAERNNLLKDHEKLISDIENKKIERDELIIPEVPDIDIETDKHQNEFLHKLDTDLDGIKQIDNFVQKKLEESIPSTSKEVRNLEMSDAILDFVDDGRINSNLKKIEKNIEDIGFRDNLDDFKFLGFNDINNGAEPSSIEIKRRSNELKAKINKDDPDYTKKINDIDEAMARILQSRTLNKAMADISDAASDHLYDKSLNDYEKMRAENLAKHPAIPLIYILIGNGIWRKLIHDDYLLSEEAQNKDYLFEANTKKWGYFIPDFLIEDLIRTSDNNDKKDSNKDINEEVSLLYRNMTNDKENNKKGGSAGDDANSMKNWSDSGLSGAGLYDSVAGNIHNDGKYALLATTMLYDGIGFGAANPLTNFIGMMASFGWDEKVVYTYSQQEPNTRLFWDGGLVSYSNFGLSSTVVYDINDLRMIKIANVVSGYSNENSGYYYDGVFHDSLDRLKGYMVDEILDFAKGEKNKWENSKIIYWGIKGQDAIISSSNQNTEIFKDKKSLIKYQATQITNNQINKKIFGTLNGPVSSSDISPKIIADIVSNLNKIYVLNANDNILEDSKKFTLPYPYWNNRDQKVFNYYDSNTYKAKNKILVEHDREERIKDVSIEDTKLKNKIYNHNNHYNQLNYEISSKNLNAMPGNNDYIKKFKNKNKSSEIEKKLDLFVKEYIDQRFDLKNQIIKNRKQVLYDNIIYQNNYYFDNIKSIDKNSERSLFYYDVPNLFVSDSSARKIRRYFLNENDLLSSIMGKDAYYISSDIIVRKDANDKFIYLFDGKFFKSYDEIKKYIIKEGAK